MRRFICKKLHSIFMAFSASIELTNQAVQGDGMASVRAIRKALLWLIDRLEEASHIFRIKEIVGPFTENRPVSQYCAEFGVVLGVILALRYWVSGQRTDNLTLLKLDGGSTPADRRRNGQKIATESDYFLMILDCGSRAQPGEREKMDCFINPVRGNRLYRPHDGVLQRLSHLAVEERLAISYFLIVEKRDSAQLDRKELRSFLQKLNFAQVSFIFVDAEFRERFKIAKELLINQVVFNNQKIAFTHDRDHTGAFIEARKYSGPAAAKVFSTVAKLAIYAVSREALDLSDELRAVLSEDEAIPKRKKRLSSEEETRIFEDEDP